MVNVLYRIINIQLFKYCIYNTCIDDKLRCG